MNRVLNSVLFDPNKEAELDRLTVMNGSYRKSRDATSSDAVTQ
jgi:hypothetical protein